MKKFHPKSRFFVIGQLADGGPLGSLGFKGHLTSMSDNAYGIPDGPFIDYIYNIYIPIWVNYNDFTATSLEIMVNKGNHPQMAELFR